MFFLTICIDATFMSVSIRYCKQDKDQSIRDSNRGLFSNEIMEVDYDTGRDFGAGKGVCLWGAAD